MAVTQNTYTGNGSTTNYSFTFPYLDTGDIKVTLNGTLTTAYTLANATTISFTSAPANGATIRIYRDTDTTDLKATFFSGSAIRAQDLNSDLLQSLYATQESENEASSATATANTALTNSATAVSTANSAVSTANSAVSTATTASTNASAAVATANTASTNASTAVSTANTASANATTAISTANSATTTANNAVTTANGAVSTANTALTNANAAVSTANTASTNASTAVSTANTASSNATSAVNTANTATTTANSAVSTANSAVSTANSAVTTANAAAAAVANAVLYTTVANVAAIPGSPSNNTAIEVTNSTGIESFTPLSGRPAGFVGSSGLSVRIIYQTAGATWTWIQYFPNDPETRYFKLSGGTITGPITVPQGTVSSPGVKFSGTGNDNTGVYSPGIDELGLVTNGVNRLAIDSAGAVSIPGTLGVTGAITGSLTGSASNNVLKAGDTMTGALGVTAGTAGAPSVFISGDTNTGLYSPGADQVAISTGGSGRLFVDSSGNIGVGGSVGFGAIDHGIHVTGSGAQEGIRLQTSAGSSGILEVYAESGGATLDTRGSGYIRFNNTTTEWARFDSSGRLGVGTSSVGAKLDVVGDIRAGKQDYSFQAIQKVATFNADGVSGLYPPSSFRFYTSPGVINGATVKLGIRAQDDINGETSDLVSIVSNSSTARVGIGVTSPNQLLQINSSSVDARIQLTNSASGSTNSDGFHLQWNNSDIYFDNKESGNFIFQSGATEAARIDSNRRLLLGTTNSAGTQLLKINGSTSGTIYGGTMSLTQGRTPPNGSTLGVLNFGSEANPEASQIAAVAEGAWTAGSSHPSNFIFYTTASGASSPQERMRIKSNGTVEIGTNITPTGLGLNLFSSSTADDYGAFACGNANTTAAACVASFYTATNSTATSNALIKFGINGYNSGSGQINANGASAAAFGTFSDARLKENIEDLPSQWDKIKSLRPVEFDYVESFGGGHQIGFIAQEMQTIYPDAVGVGENEMLTVTAWSKTEARLVKALQEALERIESLEAEVTALKAQ